MSQAVTVTSKGKVMIPERLRERFGIEAPGRVIMRETDDGLLIEPVSTPEAVGEDLRTLADQRDGEPGVSILSDGRRGDERFDQ